MYRGEPMKAPGRVGSGTSARFAPERLASGMLIAAVGGMVMPSPSCWVCLAMPKSMILTKSRLPS